MARFPSLRLLFIVNLVLTVLAMPIPASASSVDVSSPAVFVEDTIYHAIIDCTENTIHVRYGGLPLASCPITLLHPVSSVPVSGTPWVTVQSRRIFSGRQAVSDSEVAVVARVARVDPERIQRVLPDRFAVDLSNDCRLLVTTVKGQSQGRDFVERVSSVVRQFLTLGRMTIMEILVHPDDAQMLFYALEPGTPALILPPEQDTSKATAPAPARAK